MNIRLSVVERVLRRLHLLPTPVMDAFGGVLFGRALCVAVRKGFFEALSEEPLAIPHIAEKISFDAQATRILAELFVLGSYLQREGERFALSAEGRKWLVKSSPQYIGNLVRYFETLYDRWGYLDHTLQHGKPPKPYFEVFEEKDWETYVYGMRDLARLVIPEIMKEINLGENPLHMMDIGGSHGLYAIECCRRYPSLQATIVDFDAALLHTSAIIREEHMGSRVRLLGGDLTKSELLREQDAILIFNVIHGFGESENRALVDRALRSLKPRGKLYILDQLRENRIRSGLSQFLPLIVGLHLMNEIGGTTYSFEQVKMWCDLASSVRRIRLRLPGVTLVEAVR